MRGPEKEMVGNEPYIYYPLGEYIVSAPGVCGGRPTLYVRHMYVHQGEIQVLAKLSGEKFQPIPRDGLFTNEERNVTAVNIALGLLVTKTMPLGHLKEKSN